MDSQSIVMSIVVIGASVLVSHFDDLLIVSHDSRGSYLCCSDVQSRIIAPSNSREARGARELFLDSGSPSSLVLDLESIDHLADGPLSEPVRSVTDDYGNMRRIRFVKWSSSTTSRGGFRR